jgi:hypothetical protein
MKKDNIEDIYKELKTFSQEPPKELWDKVETKLHPKNRRGGMQFLWSSIALIFLALLGYMIMNWSEDSNHKPNNIITDTEQPINNNETNNSHHTNDKINISEQETTKIDNEGSSDNNEDAISNRQNTKAEKLLNNSVNQNQLSDRNTIKEKKQHGANNINQISEQKDEQSKRQNRAQKKEQINKVVKEKSTITNQEKSKYNKSYALSNKEKENNKEENKSAIKNKEMIDDKGDDFGNIINNENTDSGTSSPNNKNADNKYVINKNTDEKSTIYKNVANTNELVKASTALVLKSKGLFKFKNADLTVVLNPLRINEDSEDNTDVDEVYKKWSLEILGGIAHTTSKSSFEDVSFKTTPQNDFVYALKIGYNISSRFTIKSGIGINVLGQQIDSISYVNPNQSFATGISILQFTDEGLNLTDNQDIIFFSSQESVIVFDEEFQEEMVVPFNKGTLRQELNYIQVPLEVSYNVFKKRKYNWFIGIGGNINFLTNNKAYIDDEEIGETLDVNKTIFGATVNSNFSFNFSEKISLFVEPSYNYFQKPVDNNNQAFDNTQLRVLLGLRFRF